MRYVDLLLGRVPKKEASWRFQLKPPFESWGSVFTLLVGPLMRPYVDPNVQLKLVQEAQLMEDAGMDNAAILTHFFTNRLTLENIWPKLYPGYRVDRWLFDTLNVPLDQSFLQGLAKGCLETFLTKQLESQFTEETINKALYHNKSILEEKAQAIAKALEGQIGTNWNWNFAPLYYQIIDQARNIASSELLATIHSTAQEIQEGRLDVQAPPKPVFKVAPEQKPSPPPAPAPTPTAPKPETPSVPSEPQSAPSSSGALKVNVNTASLQELMKLPGVGKVLAERIIEFRNAYGAFRSPEDLLKVKGLGKLTLEKILPYIEF